MNSSVDTNDCLDHEIVELHQFLYDQYGYDFRDYTKASQKRRLMYFLEKNQLTSVSEIKERISLDKDFLEKLLNCLTIPTTEFFRDPSFYKVVKECVIPVLKTYAFIKLWHAGCSTGEEVFSMAILLKEENLLDRTLIYATDINPVAIEKAKKGMVPSSSIKRATNLYFVSAENEALHQYWNVHHDFATLDHSIMKNIVFSEHNLATDHVFGEMQMIICRNVLIYFNRILQEKVLELFAQSLCRSGFLGLGAKESLAFFRIERDFEAVSKPERIYRKKSRCA
jgi:chemotaxis protein methyltransferase CheR